MKKQNNIKKFTITSISAALLATSIPTTTYAAFGIFDFNVTDVPRMLRELLDTAWKQMESFLKTKSDALYKTSEFEQKINIDKISKQIDVMRSTIPNVRSCEIMLENRSYISASGGSAKSSSTKQSGGTKNQQTAGTISNQINENRKKAIDATCTIEDMKTGVNGCGVEGNGGSGSGTTKKPHLTAGLDRNASILDGTMFKVGGVTYNAGNTIANEKEGFKGGISFGESVFKGKVANELFISNVVGPVPIPITSKEINKSADGQELTAKINKYNSRHDIINSSLIKLSTVREAPLTKDAGNEVMGFWNNPKNEQLMKDILGKDSADYKSILTKTPSEDQLLQLLIYKSFSEEKVASDNIGNQKEVPLLVVNNMLLYKLYEEARTTNKLLSVIAAQQLDPIRMQEIDVLRNKADTQVKH